MIKKEVQNILEKDIVLDILNSIKNNTSLIHLTKKHNIKKQLLSYYIGKLKTLGVIEKVGYGVWKQVKELPKLPSTKSSEIRGHGFIWKIKIPQEIEGYNSIENLNRKNIKFSLINNMPRIFIDKKKVWLGKNSIIIYDINSFYDSSPVETRKRAIQELISTLTQIEYIFKINLKPYTFTTKREHYALVKENWAIQCNKEGVKIKIIDKGECWMEIDNSYNLDESEFYKTKSFSGLVNATGFQNYMNSHKKTNFEVTPTFILEVMNGIQGNQLIFAENMKSHIEAIQTLSKEVKRLSKVFKSTLIENTKLKLGNQKTLFEYE